METLEGQEQEGVIKYDPYFSERSLPLEVLLSLRELDHWRNDFYERGLIGNDPLRYGGYDYGNVSQRIDFWHGLFVITASQTGKLETLEPDTHYSIVTGYNLEANTLSAYGLKQASSEALTHAAIYNHDPSVQAILHAHHPGIWEATGQLKIPATCPDVEYGTPEMAKEMKRLLEETDARDKRIISMLGHEDGIVTFGKTLDEAGNTMLEYLEYLEYLQRASDPKTRLAIKAALLG